MSFGIETEFLTTSEMALNNASSHAEVSALLSQFTYTPEKVGEGKMFYTKAKSAFTVSGTEGQEMTEAFLKYEPLYTGLIEQYRKDRKRAKIVLEDNAILYGRLELHGRIPLKYADCMIQIESFYTVIKNQKSISDILASYNVTADHAEKMLPKIAAVKMAKESTLKETGESVAATQAKDEAFAALDNWMAQFYKTARVALEEKPELLKILGITAK